MNAIAGMILTGIVGNVAWQAMSRTTKYLGQATPVTDKLIVGGISAAALLLLLRGTSSRDFPLSALVNPASASYLAASLPPDEDSFILGAWDMVGTQVTYEGYGSLLQFFGNTVKCERCILPSELVKNQVPKANCVGKSALLASILRNRLPAEQVYLVLGTLDLGEPGGHAWVTVQKADDQWYILEPTRKPWTQPWQTAQSLADIYIPEAFLNDQALLCSDPEMCHIVTAGACPCLLDRIVV